MKKSISIIALLLFCGFFVGCKEGHDKITIVANVTLSSGSGFEKYGEQVWNGLALLKDTLAAYDIILKHQNNQGSEAVTIQNFNNWAGRADVPIVITNNSPLSKNTREVAEENKINQIALVAGDMDFCDGYQWALRDAIMQNQEGEVLAPVMLAQPDLKTIVMLGVKDDYGTDGMKYLEQELLKSNRDLNIIKSTFDKTSTSDFSSIIGDQLNSHPDAIYFAGRDKAIIAYVNQLCEQLQYTQNHIPIYICDAFDDEDVWKGLGDNAKGVVFASYYNNFDNPEGQAFLKQYRKIYKKNPGIYAVDAYVCGQYIVKLVSEGNRTAEAFNKAFESMVFDSPIKGRLYVDNHSVVSRVAAYRINENGEKELIYDPNKNETIVQ